MKTEYTPGPWHLRGDTVLVSPKLQIAQCDRGNKNPNTSQANARLIAAAPELLAALQAAVSSLEWAANLIGDIPQRSEYMETISDAQSAIRKATQP